MRRTWIILAAGVVGGALLFCYSFLIHTAKSRAWLKTGQPELHWLKDEFNLSDEEFSRVTQLHAEYIPRCEERCRHITRINHQLTDLLATADQVTPELRELLDERARLRAACQAEMLQHFFRVSRTMSPDQAKRYLTWVCENTGIQEHIMRHPNASELQDNPNSLEHQDVQ